MNTLCWGKQHLAGLTDTADRQQAKVMNFLVVFPSLLLGDPGQLPPVADKPLPSSLVHHRGYLAYHMFTVVFKLSVNHIVQGINIEQTQFRELLMRLSTGDSTEPDWHLLFMSETGSSITASVI